MAPVNIKMKLVRIVYMHGNQLLGNINLTFSEHANLFLTVIYYLFVSVALICFVLYLTEIFLSKICILHCLVLLNIVVFKPCSFRFTLER